MIEVGQVDGSAVKWDEASGCVYVRMPGLFSSVLIGLKLRAKSATHALRLAADFLEPCGD